MSPERMSKATSILSLPDDLLLSCFARISRLHYPTLSLVSKRFRSLIASPELYKTRSSLGRTESCLYVCFGSDHDPNPQWFTLCRKPDQTLTNGSSGNVLVPTSAPHSAPPHWSGLIGGPSNDIYNIGGPIDVSPSSSVTTETRSMWVDPMINVLDRKIYVTRGSKDCDPNTQNWEPELSSPPTFLSLVVRKKVFGLFNGSAYKPKKANGKGFGVGNRVWDGFLVAWSKTYCIVIVLKFSNGMIPRQESGGS